jgi:hypothetical protein
LDEATTDYMGMHALKSTMMIAYGYLMRQCASSCDGASTALMLAIRVFIAAIDHRTESAFRFG